MAKRSERRLDFFVGSNAATFRFINRRKFRRRGAIDAGAARLNFARIFRKLLLVLSGPGFYLLKKFSRARAHGSGIAWNCMRR
jgi:hypothetical protein